MARSPRPTARGPRAHEPRGGAEAGPRGPRAGHAGLCALGAQGSPLALDTRPRGPMGALAPCGPQGRGGRARRPHARCRDREGTRPRPRALAAHLLGPWPPGKREQSPHAVSAIGAHVLSPLRGQARTLGLACGGLWAPCSPTPWAGAPLATIPGRFLQRGARGQEGQARSTRAEFGDSDGMFGGSACDR